MKNPMGDFREEALEAYHEALDYRSKVQRHLDRLNESRRRERLRKSRRNNPDSNTGRGSGGTPWKPSWEFL